MSGERCGAPNDERPQKPLSPLSCWISCRTRRLCTRRRARARGRPESRAGGRSTRFRRKPVGPNKSISHSAAEPSRRHEREGRWPEGEPRLNIALCTTRSALGHSRQFERATDTSAWGLPSDVLLLRSEPAVRVAREPGRACANCRTWDRKPRANRPSARRVRQWRGSVHRERRRKSRRANRVKAA